MSAIQEPLFDRARRAPKAVQETSREAYEDVQKDIGERRLTVLRALQSYHGLQGEWPTAYELLEWMRKWRPTFDHNTVRPRLTELKDDDLRLVTAADKRKCSVTNKRAFVWSVTPRGAAYLRGAK